MAPRRGRKKISQVVKTTKVVEERVEVSIVGDESQVAEVDLAQTPTKVSERREEHSSVTTKTIPIQDDDATQDNEPHNKLTQETETETQEPEFPLDEPSVFVTTEKAQEKIGTPPREETRPRHDEALDEDQPRKRAKKESQKGQPKAEKKAQNEAQAHKKVGRKKGRRMKEMGEGREGYKSYVFKVLKQVHPGMAVSGKAMTVINNLMSDMFERLASEASRLSMHAKKNTLSAREIQGAVKLLLPGELGKHAIAEGNKAVTNYINYGNKLV